MSDTTIIGTTDVTPINTNVHGLVTAVPRGAPLALPMGSSHLALPQWRNLGGPVVFPIVGHSGGSTLTGMGAPNGVETVEFPFAGAMVVIVAAALSILTEANSSASPVGMRFASAVEIDAGNACMFVLASDGSENKWYPVLVSVPSP